MSFGKVKIDKADKLFSLWIRSRDNWTCQRCNKKYTPPTAALHCSHFVGRGKESTRFDPENASAHCYGCHQYLTSYPDEHVKWKITQLGQEKVDALILKSNIYQKKDRVSEEMYWEQRLLKDFGIK